MGRHPLVVRPLLPPFYIAQMQFHSDHSLLMQAVSELQQPNPNRVLLLDGPAAARVEFAEALAARLNGRIHRIAAPNAAAESYNADTILFFDEADSLFGKRSSVKDAHDRYANVAARYRVLILGTDNAETLPPHILQRARRVSLKGH
jgi:hypothetical protein